MPFSLKAQTVGESHSSPFGGCHNICLLLGQFHIVHITQMKWSTLTHLKAWGDADQFHSDVAFLLILPKEGMAEERTYGLTMVWAHPYQVRVSTIEEAIQQLDKLIPPRPNWPYALVCLNREACHVPLSTEGHLSLMNGGEAPATFPVGESANWQSANF